jgi:hypothetical protein
MFKIPKTNVIESDEGFSVEVLGQTGVLYSEGERTLKVDSEVLAGPAGLVIYSDSITRWASPHDQETLDASRRKIIIENIQRAFRFRGLEIEVS